MLSFHGSRPIAANDNAPPLALRLRRRVVAAVIAAAFLGFAWAALA
jgi:hypothetical protein